MMDVAPTRPVLRWHGGKWKLAPWIISHFPEHRVYVEPYGGGASVLLRKARSYGEVYNDMDGEIVNLFRVARDRGEALYRTLELTPFARTEFDHSYEPDEEPVEQARRTLVRSFMGFGSAAASGEGTGFRANSNRSGTTPAHDWKNFPDCLPAIIGRLRGVVIENKDALAVMAQHDTTETLHYCDPPYVHDTRSLGNPYCKKGYKFEMSDDDHRGFAAAARSLNGSVIVSGYACPLYDDLFRGWERRERQSHADGALPRIEVLWLNSAASNAITDRNAQRELIV